MLCLVCLCFLLFSSCDIFFESIGYPTFCLLVENSAWLTLEGCSPFGWKILPKSISRSLRRQIPFWWRFFSQKEKEYPSSDTFQRTEQAKLRWPLTPENMEVRLRAGENGRKHIAKTPIGKITFYQLWNRPYPKRHSLWPRAIVYARGMLKQAVSNGAVDKILASYGSLEHGWAAISLKGEEQRPRCSPWGVADYRCSAGANRWNAVKWYKARPILFDGIPPPTMKTAPSLTAFYWFCYWFCYTKFVIRIFIIIFAHE